MGIAMFLSKQSHHLCAAQVGLIRPLPAIHRCNTFGHLRGTTLRSLSRIGIMLFLVFPVIVVTAGLMYSCRERRIAVITSLGVVG